MLAGFDCSSLHENFPLCVAACPSPPPHLLTNLGSLEQHFLKKVSIWERCAGLRGALGSPRDASIDAHMRGGTSSYPLWTSDPSMLEKSLQSPLEVPEGLFSSLPHEEEIVNPFSSHNHLVEPSMYGPHPSGEGAGRHGNGPVLPLTPSPLMQRWQPRIRRRPDPSEENLAKELQELGTSP